MIEFVIWGIVVSCFLCALWLANHAWKNDCKGWAGIFVAYIVWVVGMMAWRLF
jgi:hypothetical protein